MINLLRLLLLLLLFLVAGCNSIHPLPTQDFPESRRTSANERLWYQYPGQDWNSQALHLGNGYFGASFFGGVKQERFTLGEKTFWTGGPGDSTNNTYGILPGGKDHIREIRQLILAGRIEEADQLYARHMMGDYSRFGSLSTIGNLCLNFKNHEGTISNYVRELDLRQAIGSVSYEVKGISYRREYFCSHPARALVLRLTCSPPGGLSFDVGIDPAHRKRHPVVEVSPDKGLWELSGKIDDNNRLTGNYLSSVVCFCNVW